jgi:hypothetical protein
MTTMHNLGLPASEWSKLTPARSRHAYRAVPEELVRATADQEHVVTAPAVRRRPPNHLSGFARA